VATAAVLVLGSLSGVYVATGAAQAASAAGARPCNIYAAGHTPCVAAYSTVRALYQNYSGPLYEVRASDGATINIGVLSPGGFSDAAAQNSFCLDTVCTVTRIYPSRLKSRWTG
jgi:hypothetical protein